jgi:hypothetical protein
MTITAKEMNRIAIARRQAIEAEINEMVANYFEWKVATKIEAAASNGRLYVQIDVNCREDVYPHMDRLLAYCHSLGFETVKVGREYRGTRARSFRVLWKDVPEEEGICVGDYDDFFDIDEEDIII